MTKQVFAWVLLALWPAVADAGVRVVVGPDGKKAIVDEGGAQRVRRSTSVSRSNGRISIRLREVPTAELDSMIAYHAESQNLDPKLVMALIQAESNYNARAVSKKGAIGLMQLMPGTAKLLRVSDPYDPDENLRGGTTYLRKMIDRFAGRIEFAVAAYNAGPGAVEKHGGIPPYRETRDYVRKVLALYNGEDFSLPALSLRPASPQRKTYLTRNAQNRIVVTTALR